MRFSITHLLIFVACAAVAVFLAQFPGHISMAVILLGLITPAFFLLTRDKWRLLTYGGMLGILITGAFIFGLTHVLHMHLPRPPIQSGYDRGIPMEQIEFANHVNPFIVPVGVLIDSTLCLAWNERNQMAQNPHNMLTECTNCGRRIANTTTICPKCMIKTKTPAQSRNKSGKGLHR